ncbi:polysaccharide deacetylase family protein [Virgibacillus sp. NKC19-16]|uniref:polysaccharide deacetylase family protein n=1 Tax=Virgibacillus salidurans TaxID=2831673 RepID=UPI001F439435|nr:polysaccharide deacetylase family protein [Virgibacillus sp. NKC19-16]UJL46586.1 polysaccharide deacetylase family protein [Virgibacillus sp. NKC19-16]
MSQSQPEGGSESVGREPNLVANSILQREYPNIVFLSGSSEENRVALTFDDGPDMRFTPQVLDVLNRYQVNATFFLMGARAAEYPDIVRRANAEGHAIGNHTYWHPNLAEESLGRAHWEVTTTEETIEQILGFRPRLFRPPYGNLNRQIVELLGSMGNTIILWNVDSLDWRQLEADVIADNVLGNTMPGSIILMHDGGDWTMDLSGTVNALDTIIPRLQQEGMEFVTIPELINVSEAK